MANKKQECMIIGASPIESEAIFQEFPPENYYVICADGGYETAVKHHITPDLIVGDFDSTKVPPQKNRKVVTLPVQKDVTDTMYAVMKGFAKGFRHFVLLGCLGGPRFDHSLAIWKCSSTFGSTVLGSLPPTNTGQSVFIFR